MGCHFLLQGIFNTQGSNPGFPHCRQTLLPSEPPGSLHLNLIWMYQRFSCSQICNSHSLRVTTVMSLCPTAKGVHLPSSPLRSVLTFLVLRLTFLRHCSLSHPPYLVSCQNFITISFSVRPFSQDCKDSLQQFQASRCQATLLDRVSQEFQQKSYD